DRTPLAPGLLPRFRDLAERQHLRPAQVRQSSGRPLRHVLDHAVRHFSRLDRLKFERLWDEQDQRNARKQAQEAVHQLVELRRPPPPRRRYRRLSPRPPGLPPSPSPPAPTPSSPPPAAPAGSALAQCFRPPRSAPQVSSRAPRSRRLSGLWPFFTPGYDAETSYTGPPPETPSSRTPAFPTPRPPGPQHCIPPPDRVTRSARSSPPQSRAGGGSPRLPRCIHLQRPRLRTRSILPQVRHPLSLGQIG